MLDSLLNSENISKYILVFDLFYDVDPELFHQTFTKGIVDYYDREFREHGKEVSEEIFSLNLFVRYIAVDVYKELGKSFYKEMREASKEDPYGEFRFIRDYVKDKYTIGDFVYSRGNIRRAGSVYFQFVYFSKYHFLLKILYEKGESFVSELFAENISEYCYETSVVENFSGYRDFAFIRGRRSGQVENISYKIDIVSCRKFLKSLDEKISKRNLNLDLSSF